VDFVVSKVNSFAGEGTEGNPAGVLFTDKELSSALMQKIALRMGFSETAFLYPVKEAENSGGILRRFSRLVSAKRTIPVYYIRWFTTLTEVPLCGHATLAAAALLFQNEQTAKKGIFYSESGKLIVYREEDRFMLDFPLDIPQAYNLPENLLAALGLENYETVVLGEKTGYLLIRLRNEEMVREVSPNYPLLKGIRIPGITGICITSLSDDPAYDFVSRFFDPWAGIMEDPVTGSAHTLLGPYWQKILYRSNMKARQLSRRGGVLLIRIENDKRISIGGKAEITGEERISIV
jgi:PhzF family phenazine biosynthesis protein